jgi:IS30 family transposase
MEPGEVVRTPGKLILEEKAHILAWKEEGISSAKIAQRLGRHRASIDRLLAKTKGLPKYQIPNRKRALEGPKRSQSAERDAEEVNQIIKYPAMRVADQDQCP